MTRAAVVLYATVALAVLHAQEPPTFDVVSIKLNTARSGRSGIQSGSDGAFVATNVTLHRLILDAFGVQASQLVGGPDWMTTERFDVIATGQKDDGRNGERERAMLAERFHLATHTEMRDRPVFNLVMLRADRKLGPSIRPATIDCHGGGVDDPDKARREANVTPCGLRASGGRQGASLLGGGRTLPEIARILADYGADRQVFDKTGLTGSFDFELKWANQAVNADDVTFFTAIQEQLGLKLEAATAPVEVTVIDRVEHPEPN
jgi:uncharacterized protein (TIGR03435 family)